MNETLWPMGSHMLNEVLEEKSVTVSGLVIDPDDLLAVIGRA
ncbi:MULTISPECIES: hypothetical protein [unclassified Ornithinimicrobium]